MEVKLLDPANRVSRLIHRTTPGGELIYLDLRGYYRGEIWCGGSDGDMDLFMIRCHITTPASRVKRDKEDQDHLIEVKYTHRRGSMLLTHWSKGTLTALVTPMNSWLPSASKKWTCVKDHE